MHTSEDSSSAIESLITAHQFVFSSWTGRYSRREVWAALVPTGAALTVLKGAVDGPSDFYRAADYLTTLEWMPVVKTDTQQHALMLLNERLTTLPLQARSGGSPWALAVDDIMTYLNLLLFNRFREEGLQRRLQIFPTNFNDLVNFGGASKLIAHYADGLEKVTPA